MEDGTEGFVTGHPAGFLGTDGSKPKEMGEEGSPGKIKFGSHEFDSIEEVTAAYEKLESAYGEQGRVLGELRSGKSSASVRRTLDFKKLGDTLIENPEEGVKELTGYVDELVEEKVSALKSTVLNERETVDREDKIWDGFLEQNPWLAHRKREVQVVTYNVLWPQVKGKSPEEQFKVIADHFRDSTERSAMVLSGRELPERRPVSVGTGTPSGVSGASRVEPKAPARTFMDSVKANSYVPKAGF